jgi:DNA mismatch repair protein MutS2
MKFFTEKSDSQTLFLIDEFGAGTEPNLGGSIAEAVLEELNRKQSFGVVTTHYANLKLLSEKCNGIVNGAMLFDITELKPLFKLKIGKPGSSFAFEIAKKIGFPNQILSSAEEKIGAEQVNFDQQLQQLEIEKEKIEKGQRRLNIADEFLNEMIEKYNKLHQQLEHSRKEILTAAKVEAKQILDKSNQIIEKTIREIKESQADKEKTKQLRQEIIDYKEDLETANIKTVKPQEIPLLWRRQGVVKTVRSSEFKVQSSKFHKEKPVSTPNSQLSTLNSQPTSPITIGDFVRLQETSTIGKVTEIKNNQALIAFDSISMRLEINRLEKIKDYQPPHHHRPNLSGVMSDFNDRKAQFNTTLDLRGIRSEEALQMTDKYIDEAAMLSIKQLRILHGKGYGILRTLIRETLAKNTLVEHFEDEFVEAGGTGITLVRVK